MQECIRLRELYKLSIEENNTNSLLNSLRKFESKKDTPNGIEISLYINNISLDYNPYRQSALYDDINNINATYCIVDIDKTTKEEIYIIAMFTITFSHIIIRKHDMQINSNEMLLSRKLYTHKDKFGNNVMLKPVYHVAMLSKNYRFQNEISMEIILNYTFKIIKSVRGMVGENIVTLDTDIDKLKDLYVKFGFKSRKTNFGYKLIYEIVD